MILERLHTNSDWFDPNALLNVRVLGIIGIFALKNLLSTESVDECRPT